MSPRNLKIGLIASVILNVFAIAAIATALLGGFWVEREARGPRDGRHTPSMSTVDTLDPAIRDDVRARLRAIASTTREDFSASREARRTAIEQIQQGQWDKAELTRLLAESRAAEMRGRATLENGALDIIEGLEPTERAKLAGILKRHSRDHDRRRRHRDDERSATEGNKAS